MLLTASLRGLDFQSELAIDTALSVCSQVKIELVWRNHSHGLPQTVSPWVVTPLPLERKDIRKEIFLKYRCNTFSSRERSLWAAKLRVPVILREWRYEINREMNFRHPTVLITSESLTARSALPRNCSPLLSLLYCCIYVLYIWLLHVTEYENSHRVI